MNGSVTSIASGEDKVVHLKRSIDTLVIVSSILFFAPSVFSQVFMDADNTGDAYARILSKGYGYEVPDCVHPVRHITESWDTDLKKNVFLFYAHKSIDNDRCINFDRQRTEIKTWGSSPDSMIGFIRETMSFRWKFKLDSGFQPSANFTHIHQIKAGDGTFDTDNPVITITPVKASTNRLEVRFYEPIEEGGNLIKLIMVPLAPFLGTWVEAYETVKYDSNSQGTFSLQLKRLSDDSLLLNYSNSGISMWRTGITYCRPKYGIYRSLLDSNSLRDETVKFADFYLKKGTAFTLPASPGGLAALPASATRINLSWADNSNNEGQFRIDRRTNSASWAYLTTLPAGSTSYPDTGLVPSVTYFYRVRAENTYGNSQYADSAGVKTERTITATSDGNGSINPSGAVAVNYGGSQRFTFNPSAGYYVDSAIVDGLKKDSVAGYIFENVTADHTIRVVFKISEYVITATSGVNGTISPPGAVQVNHGGIQRFTFGPLAGYQTDSVLVDGVKTDSISGYTFINVSSDHAIRVTFRPLGLITLQLDVASQWNLVSVPLSLGDYSASAVYPMAAGDPFAYSGNYVIQSTLTPGKGYWLKFIEQLTVSMSGYPINCDTVQLMEGWNLIGSLSSPIPVTEILSNTPGLTLSQFFGYQNVYIAADSIKPGSGYWVKSNMAGEIILNAAYSLGPKNRILIMPVPDEPPYAPEIGSAENILPEVFSISGNYPNPFNPVTAFQYVISVDAYLKIVILNALGQEVATLVDERSESGTYQIIWNAGFSASGLYFCRMDAVSTTDPAIHFTQTRKIVLVK